MDAGERASCQTQSEPPFEHHRIQCPDTPSSALGIWWPRPKPDVSFGRTSLSFSDLGVAMSLVAGSIPICGRISLPDKPFNMRGGRDIVDTTGHCGGKDVMYRGCIYFADF